MTWDELYSHIIACTGWTWEYIDQFMTVPRFRAMEQYWRKCPPQHLLLAAFVGWKPKDATSKKAQETNTSQAEALMGMFGFENGHGQLR